MAGNTGGGRGGYRLGAGRKRVKPARGRCAEIQRVLAGVYKGLSMASLKFLPNGSDEELLELTVAGIVADEVQRGRGSEVLRLLGSLEGMSKGGGDDADTAGAGGGFDMGVVMANLPGMALTEAADSAAVDVGELEPDSGLSVREIAAAFRARAVPGAVMPGAFGSGQDELFELSPGTSITGRH